MRITVISNNKGGIGKTTSTVNLAYELALKGYKVLVLDFDQQANTTRFFRRLDTEFFIGDLLLDKKFDITKCTYSALVAEEEIPNIDIIPAKQKNAMAALDMSLTSLVSREYRLSKALVAVEGKYDYVLIDTAPGNSVLSLNALVAASDFIIPTEFRENSLEGVSMFLDHLQEHVFEDEELENIKFKILSCRIPKASTRDIEYGLSFINAMWEGHLFETCIWNRGAVFGASESALVPVSSLYPNSEESSFYKALTKEYIENA